MNKNRLFFLFVCFCVCMCDAVRHWSVSVFAFDFELNKYLKQIELPFLQANSTTKISYVFFIQFIIGQCWHISIVVLGARCPNTKIALWSGNSLSYKNYCILVVQKVTQWEYGPRLWNNNLLKLQNQHFTIFFKFPSLTDVFRDDFHCDFTLNHIPLNELKKKTLCLVFWSHRSVAWALLQNKFYWLVIVMYQSIFNN